MIGLLRRFFGSRAPAPRTMLFEVGAVVIIDRFADPPSGGTLNPFAQGFIGRRARIALVGPWKAGELVSSQWGAALMPCESDYLVEILDDPRFPNGFPLAVCEGGLRRVTQG